MKCAEAGTVPICEREVMSYRVVYGPARVAKVEIAVDATDEAVVTGSLDAESQGMARWMHPFSVQLETSVDVAGGRALEARTAIEEDGSHRCYESRFSEDPEVVTEVNAGGETRRQIVELPETAHDLISWLVELRRMVASDAVGDKAHRFTVWDGWKLTRLEVQPGSVETKKSAVGTLPCRAFELRRWRLGHDGDAAFEPTGPPEKLGTLWIERRARALPVKMTFHAPIGRVGIELMQWEERS